MNITVYCGASMGISPDYHLVARKLGEWIAGNQHTLVYGGGKVGLMGVVADAALENGSKVIGVMPKFLVEREIAHTNITELRVVEDMAVRKRMMIDLGDVFIALPGGPGTLEEISEAISLSRLGQNNGPCILYSPNNYYQALAQYFDVMVQEGFLTQQDRDRIYFVDNLQAIEQCIAEHMTPEIREYTK